MTVGQDAAGPQTRQGTAGGPLEEGGGLVRQRRAETEKWEQRERHFKGRACDNRRERSGLAFCFANVCFLIIEAVLLIVEKSKIKVWGYFSLFILLFSTLPHLPDSAFNDLDIS